MMAPIIFLNISNKFRFHITTLSWYRKELVAVKKELDDIEFQIQDLLQQQSSLQDRRQELEALLRQNTTKSQADVDKWDTTDFEWSGKLRDKMKNIFHINKLRPLQLQTMNVTMSGKDCILIMPTGGGKSLCFQLPALLSKGITLVVSPLVSLMEDQVMALENLGVEAMLLNASSPKETVNYVHTAMTDKSATLKLLYVTPEKLAKSKRFMSKLEKMYQVGMFSRLVIDEVHCCSQWGHDFRPDYKFLGIMKRQFPGVPLLGLTATATTKVIEDVKNILNLQDPYLFKASFNRPNLYYQVREKPSAMKDAVDEMYKLIQSRFRGKSGIVYCFSQKDSETVAKELSIRGIKSGCYHGNCSARERSRVHRLWLRGDILVVVATVAFGMGIDKPDVRFVIHHSLSKSMENLYQESGRAGRDDKESHCILYYRFADVFRQSTMVFTEQTGLDNLYGIMDYCIDMKKCRRSIIARHFGEVWDKSQCNHMCDHCSSDPVPKERRDVTKVCLNVLAILDCAANKDQRVTAQKVLDSLQGRGPSSLQVPGMENPKVSRDKLERILAQMLMQGIIREDFHFTPYSTISYIVKGNRARLLTSGKLKVDMDFPSKIKSPSAKETAKSGSATPSKSDGNLNDVSKDLKNRSKNDTSINGASVSSSVPSVSKTETKSKNKSAQSAPKLVVINKQNSLLTNLAGSNVTDDTKKGCKQGSEKKRISKVKKRKPVICESDSDDLDFDNDKTMGKPPLRKKKPKVEIKESMENGGGSLLHDNIDDISFDLDFDMDDFEFKTSTSDAKESGSIQEKPIFIESDNDMEDASDNDMEDAMT